jgi:hypothetical protein
MISPLPITQRSAARRLLFAPVSRTCRGIPFYGPLRKWFCAAYLIGHDKRGVSALMVSTELAIRYETAWLMCHKVRHALTERDEFRLQDFIEVDETFYGGRRVASGRQSEYDHAC